MHTLNHDFLYDVGGLANVIRPRRRNLIDRVLGRLAIGQILREQFVYEVHGPYVAVDPEPPRRSLYELAIDRISAWADGFAYRSRLRRAAEDVAWLDDRLLKDIGITRAEIDAVVFGASVGGRQN